MAPLNEQPPQTVKKDKPLENMTVDELYQKGQGYYQDPFSPDAEKCYKEMLTRGDTIDSRANMALGILFYQRGSYKKATQYFKNYLQRNPLDVGSYGAHFYLGLIHLNNGNLEEAKEELFLANRNREFEIQSLYYLSRIEFLRKNYDAGIKYLTEASKLDRNYTKIYNALSIGYRKSGLLDKALIFVERGLNADPLDCNLLAEKWFMGKLSSDNLHFYFDRNDSTFIGSQLYIETAAGYMETGEWKDAASILELAIKHFKLKGYVYPMLEYYLGYCYQQLGNEAEAVSYYNKASKNDSEYVFPYRQLSETVLSSALLVNPHEAKTCMYLGNLLTYLRRHEEGLKAWENAYKLNKSNDILLHNLAGANWYLYSDTAQTIRYLEEALKSAPCETRLLDELDHMYEYGGQTYKRVDLFEKYKQIVESDDRLVHSYITLLLRLGYEAELESNYNKAGECFKEAAYLIDKTYFYPQEATSNRYIRYAEAHNGMGAVLLSEGNPKEALKHFEKGITVPPVNLSEGLPAKPVYSRVYYLMGEAYKACGNRDSANVFYHKVIGEQISPLSESGIYKGLSMLELGNKNEAADYFNMFINSLYESLLEEDTENKNKEIKYYVLSRAFEELGNKNEADRYMHMAIEINPDVVLQARIQASYIPWNCEL